MATYRKGLLSLCSDENDTDLQDNGGRIGEIEQEWIVTFDSATKFRIAADAIGDCLEP